MVRAAFTDCDFVVDFHSRMGVTAGCASHGGTNYSDVSARNLTADRKFSSAPVMRSGVVNLFGALWVLLAPFSALLIQACAITVSVLSIFLAIIIRLLQLAFAAAFIRPCSIARALARAPLLLREVVWVFLAFLAQTFFDVRCILGPVFDAVGPKLLFVRRLPSRLIGPVFLGVLRGPLFGPLACLDLSRFRIHAVSLPCGAGANNYAFQQEARP